MRPRYLLPLLFLFARFATHLLGVTAPAKQPPPDSDNPSPHLPFSPKSEKGSPVGSFSVLQYPFSTSLNQGLSTLALLTFGAGHCCGWPPCALEDG